MVGLKDQADLDTNLKNNGKFKTTEQVSKEFLQKLGDIEKGFNDEIGKNAKKLLIYNNVDDNIMKIIVFL